MRTGIGRSAGLSSVRLAALLAASLFFFTAQAQKRKPGPGSQPAQRMQAGLTFREARANLLTLFSANRCLNKDPLHGVRVTYSTLEVSGIVPFGKGDERDGSFVIPFDDVKEIGNTWPSRGEFCGTWGDTVRIEMKDRQPNRFLYLLLDTPDAAEKAVSDIEWLVAHADENVAAAKAREERFKQDAAAWRAANPKPTLPDSVHEHDVLARNAIEEKNLAKALSEYDAGLEIFPTWPEGQFNMALICSETGDYGCAIEHMENYLELMPDAPDAKAAKDKLIIWRDKVGK
jgi:tetratricopeptide (TPR) repeat protein